MVDEMIWSTASCSLVQPTKKIIIKEHLLDYKSTVWCGFPTFSKNRTFRELSGINKKK